MKTAWCVNSEEKMVNIQTENSMGSNWVSEHSSIEDSRSFLFRENPVYKPFRYGFAYEAWETQQRMHWLPEEVPIHSDVRDWKSVLTDQERNLLTNIFRFFTQSDIEVGGCYTSYYLQIFQPTEVKMMLVSFANMETVHIAAYAYLLDSLGIPEIEYEAFFQYKEMKNKWDYMKRFKNKATLKDLLITLVVYAAFVEGLQLFASFSMLLNFPRFNKMKGMGQIVTWSVRDETLHVHSLLKLFYSILQEHPGIWTDSVKAEVELIGRTMVSHEEAFIDLAFEQGPVEGLTPEMVKGYIHYIADRRFEQLLMNPVYHVKKNPLEWIDPLLSGIEYTNFFENRATEYAKSATQGTWEEVFARLDRDNANQNVNQKIQG
ncbi:MULTISPECIES: ribonucleotide-diphosphate reductase subunit beta [Holospora]|uniref:Ribonucleoside-diphosphate reductase subunit beta n=2 Tax=Holospora TaxID=44747 RepID=A0A061JI12_9PROT|nr:MULTISPECIES: ribonucleotide-diphosphate reductase subunit beta [Holospora]ETZ04609.1 putative ribonucleoside-diphosphate reductase small subunit 376L [Holospora undulata HU1]GAJ46190.1 putative ribonucleoside-diphosphate reductase small subunit 376L [Holospora elegans E1]